jgi:hypothetical protein
LAPGYAAALTIPTYVAIFPASFWFEDFLSWEGKEADDFPFRLPILQVETIGIIERKSYVLRQARTTVLLRYPALHHVAESFHC